MPVAFHRLRVAEVRPENDEVVSVAFEVPASLASDYRYTPGQHLTLRRTFDGQEVRRSYSICSGLTEHELRVAIKRVPGGRFSEWVHQALRPGMELEVMTPAGRFTLHPDPSRTSRYLGLAVGKGITPIMALLKSVLACEPRSAFALVYGNRDARSILFREQLSDLKDRYLHRFQLVHVLSRQEQHVPLLHGRLDAPKLRGLIGEVISLDGVDEVFICVPQPTAYELRDELIARGIGRQQIHVELFGAAHAATPAQPEAPGDGNQTQLSVVARGVRTEIAMDPGATVLEAGLAAGLDVPFSCRDGVCATCRAHLDEGEVRMAANYALEPWELERGFVLTCQSRPVSPRVVVDYDRI